MGKILALGFIVLLGRLNREASMTDTENQHPEGVVAEEKTTSGVDSRRRFLKVSMAAGATVAVMAAGVNFIPALASAAKPNPLGSNTPAVPSTSSSDPLILVLEGDSLSVYNGENKYTTNDILFARQISSSVRSRL